MEWWDYEAAAVEAGVENVWDTVAFDTGASASDASSWFGDAWDTVYDWGSGAYDNVSDWIGETWDWINDTVDSYVWDTTQDTAIIEGWIRDFFDITDQEGTGFAEEAGEKIVETVTTIVEQGKDIIEHIIERISSVTTTITHKLGGIVNNITVMLGAGWDAALLALSDLPELITKFVDIDEDTFVEDAVKAVKAQKKILTRLAKEGLIG